MKCLKRKGLLLLANKLIEKIPDSRNAKKQYQSFIRKKNTKLLKQSETLYKLSKTKKVGYIVLQKSEYFLNAKKVKITKPAHAFTGYVRSYNVEILNYVNCELQLKDTESAFKSKLID